MGINQVKAVILLYLTILIGACSNTTLSNDLGIKHISTELNEFILNQESIDSWSLLISDGSRPIDLQQLILVIGYTPGTNVEIINSTNKEISELNVLVNSGISVISKFRWTDSYVISSETNSSILENTQRNFENLQIKYLDYGLIIKSQLDLETNSFIIYYCSNIDFPDSQRIILSESAKSIILSNNNRQP